MAMGRKTLQEIIALNNANLHKAFADYASRVNTWDLNAVADVSDEFIANLAYDCSYAKRGLREVFSKVRGWDDALQAVVWNGNITHDTDWQAAECLAKDIVAPYSHNLSFHSEKFRVFWTAMRLFTMDESLYDYRKERIVECVKEIAPRAYRSNRPVNRIFREFCKVIGVYSDERGSDFQRLYAEYSDELKGRKLDTKLFVSINPAAFVTMSNPKRDKFGETLVSCHSFNHGEYNYGSGTTGYARDNVTFVVFSAADSENPATLNYRKTFRMLGMYKPHNGVLLLSRPYDTAGGHGKQTAFSNTARDITQRIIAEGENAVNLWQTMNYNTSTLRIERDDNFMGYPDWIQFTSDAIKISFLKEMEGSYKPFTVGAPSLCVKCGRELFEDSPTYYCADCDPRERCDECNTVLSDDETYWGYNCDGEYVPLCADCLSANYERCAECGEYHHVDAMHQTESDEYVCDACRAARYVQCDECGCLVYNGNLCYGIRDGEEVALCNDCCAEYYAPCDKCGEYFHRDNLTASDDDTLLCERCLEENE